MQSVSVTLDLQLVLLYLVMSWRTHSCVQRSHSCERAST